LFIKYLARLHKLFSFFAVVGDDYAGSSAALGCFDAVFDEVGEVGAVGADVGAIYVGVVDL
jgi:hypothetical protein